MAEPTFYLFDGYNLVHAGGFDVPELVNRLADFLAQKGVEGIVVFDGVGDDASVGPLSVRYAADADALLERLAAERRATEVVLIVSSDNAVRATTGLDVQKRGSAAFAEQLPPVEHTERTRSELLDRLDAETLAKLQRLRRGT